MKKHLDNLVKVFERVLQAINQPIVGELLYYVMLFVVLFFLFRILARGLQ